MKWPPGVATGRKWEELRAALAAQHASCPARVRVVRRSQCLHRVSPKLLAQAWQTRACDSSTGPDRAGMLRGVVSRERRHWFSELADVTVAVLRSRIGRRATTGGCGVLRELRQ